MADFSVVSSGSEIEDTIFYDPVRVKENAHFKNKIVIDGTIYDSSGEVLSEEIKKSRNNEPIKERAACSSCRFSTDIYHSNSFNFF